MKKIFLSAAILFIATISNAQFTSANLTAAGLTCAMCTKAIYNALEKVPSVDKVDADIKSSSFAIRFKNGSAIDPDILRKAVEDAGFSLAKMSLTGNFNHVVVGDDAHVNIGGKVYHFLQAGSAVTLQGEKTLHVVDRKFVSAKEFKKLVGSGAHLCLESGKAEKCCPKSVVAMNTRVYHVTL